LIQNYLRVNKTKEAKSLLRKLEKNPENQQNLGFVFTEGAYYEKKGDYRRAEGFFRAWYNADKNEVSVIQIFAAFLIRKTDQLETSNAEDLATEAIKMLKHASELSPENQEIPKALEVVRKKFPKLDKI
jgi:tetratricopeptide (TPR) repeat protein